MVVSLKREPTAATQCLAGCWVGCSPRCAKQQQQAAASEATTDHDKGGIASAADREIMLDAGFAVVRLQKLKEASCSPSHALCIEALFETYKNGMETLFKFLDKILLLPELKKGFVLVYDLRRLGDTQRNMISEISCWISDPQRKALWTDLCYGWYVLYPQELQSDDVSFQAAKTWLWMLFFSHSPGACPVYIITDPMLIGKQLDEDSLCFEPDEDMNLALVSAMGLSTAVVGYTASALTESVAAAAGTVVDIITGRDCSVDCNGSSCAETAQEAPAKIYKDLTRGGSKLCSKKGDPHAWLLVNNGW